MKKILITGGAGFIGLNLAKRLLDEGYKVDIADNFSRAVQDSEIIELEKNSNLRLLEVDLLEKNKLETLDKDYVYIFHLAAIIGVRHVLERPYSVLSDNINLLTNIISFAKKQKEFSRLLFASTSEVYAGTLDSFTLKIPTPENTPLTVSDLSHPRSSYMLSKIYGEALCHNSGLPFTLFRPHNIYGPRMGMSHVIPEQFLNIYKSQENDFIDVFSVNHTRAFCYIDDAIEMIYRLMNSKECIGETLNIGSQKPEITINELVKNCIKVANKTVKINSIEGQTGSPSRRCPDMSKTFKLLKFESQTSLTEGLSSTYCWYEKNIFSKDSTSAI
jgi:nucleoside-diphosphate-sugar epimerase